MSPSRYTSNTGDGLQPLLRPGSGSYGYPAAPARESPQRGGTGGGGDLSSSPYESSNNTTPQRVYSGPSPRGSLPDRTPEGTKQLAERREMMYKRDLQKMKSTGLSAVTNFSSDSQGSITGSESYSEEPDSYNPYEFNDSPSARRGSSHYSNHASVSRQASHASGFGGLQVAGVTATATSLSRGGSFPGGGHIPNPPASYVGNHGSGSGSGNQQQPATIAQKYPPYPQQQQAYPQQQQQKSQPNPLKKSGSWASATVWDPLDKPYEARNLQHITELTAPAPEALAPAPHIPKPPPSAVARQQSDRAMESKLAQLPFRYISLKDISKLRMSTPNVTWEGVLQGNAAFFNFLDKSLEDALTNSLFSQFPEKLDLPATNPPRESLFITHDIFFEWAVEIRGSDRTKRVVTVRDVVQQLYSRIQLPVGGPESAFEPELLKVKKIAGRHGVLGGFQPDKGRPGCFKLELKDIDVLQERKMKRATSRSPLRD